MTIEDDTPMYKNMLPCFTLLVLVSFVMGVITAQAQDSSLLSLPDLSAETSAAENALWIENPIEKRFHHAKRVVIADIQGPAVIQMVHFAVPHSHFAEPVVKLNRDLLLKIYWDGETNPSVDCPLVDFFCDPDGRREILNTALVNKRRGFNAYFPMPFRKSARMELVYDGPVEPGDELWRIMPCYSYVVYQKLDCIPENTGYFHAHWRQESLLMGKQDYVALEAEGKGKWIGWNVTVRKPGSTGYAVDMNERFFIDGQELPAIEFQGIEDSFGFSWGFPESENLFPCTGYFPFFKGAAAYRFFISDAIRFDRSLRVTIGFGANEHPMFREQFSAAGNEFQMSSVVYWYQTEPHAPLPPLPPATERRPAPEDPFWLHPEQLPTLDGLKARGVRLYMLLGRPEREVIYAAGGFQAEVTQGYAYAGWPMPIYHCRASENHVEIVLTVPPNATGILRLFVIDPDHFQGGRSQEVAMDGGPGERIDHFHDGRWLEYKVTAEQTADRKLVIQARNTKPNSNAVVSVLEWIEQS
ncbi:MAG: DUF2961 domain-containing protein [Pirellulales bacterium]|nr:DUF2961 domain-containing protein [Pirellulales bacterium]